MSWRDAFSGGVERPGQPNPQPDEFLEQFREMILGESPLRKYREYYRAYARSGTANHYRLWQHDVTDWDDKAANIEPLEDVIDTPEDVMARLTEFGIPGPVPFMFGDEQMWAFVDSGLPRFWAEADELQSVARLNTAMSRFAIRALKVGVDIRDTDLLVILPPSTKLKELREEGATARAEGRYFQSGRIHNDQLRDATLEYPPFPPPKWER